MDDDVGARGERDETTGAEAIASEIVKALKSLRLYDRDNRIVGDRLASLNRVLDDYLGEHGSLTVDIYPFELRCREAVVHEDPVKERSLPFKLYTQGLRRLTLLDSLRASDTAALLEVLNADPSEDETAEDDVITLLWEKNIRGIDYQVAEESLSEGSEGALEAFLDGAAEGYSGGGEPEVAADAVEPEELDELERPQSLPTEEVKLAPAEMATIAGELAAEGARDLLLDVQEVLFEAVRLCDDDEERDRLIEVSCRMMESLLEGPSGHRALSLLVHTRVLADFYFADERRAQPLVEALDRRLALARNIRGLRRMAESVPDESLSEVRRILGTLPVAATPELVTAVAESRLGAVRRAFADVVVDRGASWLGNLRQAIAGANGAPARDLLDAASRIEGGLKLVIEATEHTDPQVRRAAVQLLAEHGPASILDHLLPLVDDPDQRVRTAAIWAIGQAGGLQGAEVLREQIEAGSFRGREHDEQRSVLVAYARLAGPRAVPLLREMLLRKNWFGRSRHVGESLAAAEALARIDGPLAIRALEQGGASTAKEIRERCLALIARRGAVEV